MIVHQLVLSFFLLAPTASSFAVPPVHKHFVGAGRVAPDGLRPCQVVLMSDTEEGVAIEEESADAGPEMTEEEKLAASSKRKIQRERYTMFVGNLPFETSDEEIKKIFSEHGKVELVSIPRDKNSGLPRGFAFVDMGSPEEVDVAIEALHGTFVGGRDISVSKSVAKDKLPKKEKREPAANEGKVYMGNIPFDATKEEIVEFYQEIGEVKDVFIPTNSDNGLGRGFAFVTFAKEDVQKAIDGSNGAEFGGRTLVVNEPLPPGQKAPKRNLGRTKLYVGNLSFYTVQETLYELFEEVGEVFDCYLPEDRETGSSRGFGFVTMSKEAAEQAVDTFDGCEVDGRIINVNVAQRKREPQPSIEDSKEYSDE